MTWRNVWVLVGVAVLGSCKSGAKPPPPDAGSAPQLLSIGPRSVSNQTAQPLTVLGERLTPGLSLLLGPPVDRKLPLEVLDERHAYARLPAGTPLGTQSEVLTEVRLLGGEGTAPLRLVNDTGFPDLVALEVSPDGARAFVASQTEDVVYVVSLSGGAVKQAAVDDGPRALATWIDANKRAWLVVGHAFSPKLVLLAMDTLERREVPAPSGVASVLVSADGVAFVAEHERDSVAAIDLARGQELWRAPVDPNPSALALGDGVLAVGSLQAGTVALLGLADGHVQAVHEPGPGTPIVGGGTEKFSRYVMGGTAPRAQAFSAKRKALFVASIGPNVGPNPAKHEVSMNGGVAVVDPTKGWVRHLGFGAGVTQALVLDEAAGLLYATDMGLGLVRVLDVAKLTQSDAAARQAVLQELAVPAPPDFPLVRPVEDFTVSGRAGPSLHSGPVAAKLLLNGKELLVLNRFTGTLVSFDVAGAKKGKAQLRRSLPVVNTLAQAVRRQGQVLYFADLGRTAMSCDACHVEGHTGGVLFEKTQPLRVYRSPTVRGSRESPPYFTPASTFSMGETAKVVGGRNRFHNPDPTGAEVEALALYSSLVTTLPNPFVGADGAPQRDVTLPDGTHGDARQGLALFEGKAGCAGCHPAPHFTTDQDPSTRGQFLDVGTPRLLPLREAMQDATYKGFAPPALMGSWDVFPMLTTGLAGLAVQPDEAVRVHSRFALKDAVEKWAPTHGRADLLDEAERRALLAYVLSL